MKIFSAWLIQLIALTAAGAAYGQEYPEIRPAVSDGCSESSCDTDLYPASVQHVTPLKWPTFQVHPVWNIDPQVIWEEGTLFNPTEFARATDYLQLGKERTWAQNLSQIQELRIITLWQNPGSKIFLGIDSHGFAGLNFSQTIRRKSQPFTSNASTPASSPIGPLSPPLVHAQSLTYEKPDLSHTLRTE